MRAQRRPAYTVLVVLATLAVVLAFAVVLGRLVVIEYQRDRQLRLEMWAGQVLASARAWSVVRAGELAADRPVGLPLEGVLPPEVRGRAIVQRRAVDGGAVAVCELTLDAAGRRLRREAAWSLPGGPPPPPGP